MVRSRSRPVPAHPLVLTPETLLALTSNAHAPQNPVSAGSQAPSAAAGDTHSAMSNAATDSGLKESKVLNE